MEEKIKEELEKEVSKMGIHIYSVEYVKEGSNNFLRVTIDRDEIIDIDTCEKVTHVINPILDELDLIKESYILDVSTTGLITGSTSKSESTTA